MAVVFLSHASTDDTYACSLQRWLVTNGFPDLFVDHSSIRGGDIWTDALKKSVHDCRVVIFLVTPNWLASTECFGEFQAAWYMGKRLVPLRLLVDEGKITGADLRKLSKVFSEAQGIKLDACVSDDVLDLDRDEGVAKRLRDGLRAAGANSSIGLDPEAFEIDRTLKPAPFPGLTSFGDDDADAAIFYGRSREIANVTEDLRKLRALSDRRPLVILGASGAGKSSLLRAGLIPRLRRETPIWIPLRVFRPGADPLYSFADALKRTMSQFDPRASSGELRDELMGAWESAERKNQELTDSGWDFLSRELDRFGCLLREKYNRPHGSILLSVDQAEDLINAEGRSATALADFLRAACRMSGQLWRVVLTIRTDAFESLQEHEIFKDLDTWAYDLRSLSTYRFADVVERPAIRYGVRIDPELSAELFEDAQRDDSLPLLAFALRRLWEQYSEVQSITRQHYINIGRISGLLEDAAERALRGLDPNSTLSVPLSSVSLDPRTLTLARSTFVPTLAGFDNRGRIIRRIAFLDNFDMQSQNLLRHFIEWRLVVCRTSDGREVVEVAHEALFREWKALKSWLDEDREALISWEIFRDAVLDWLNNGLPTRWAFITGRRLDTVKALFGRQSYAEMFDNSSRQYMTLALACSEENVDAVWALIAQGLVLYPERFCYLANMDSLKNGSSAISFDESAARALADAVRKNGFLPSQALACISIVLSVCAYLKDEIPDWGYPKWPDDDLFSSVWHPFVFFTSKRFNLAPEAVEAIFNRDILSKLVTVSIKDNSLIETRGAALDSFPSPARDIAVAMFRAGFLMDSGGGGSHSQQMLKLSHPILAQRWKLVFKWGVENKHLTTVDEVNNQARFWRKPPKSQFRDMPNDRKEMYHRSALLLSKPKLAVIRSRMQPEWLSPDAQAMVRASERALFRRRFVAPLLLALTSVALGAAANWTSTLEMVRHFGTTLGLN